METLHTSETRTGPTMEAPGDVPETRHNVLSVVGLFAGIGGLELGLERAGLKTELLCELMPEARAVLQSAQQREDEHRAFEGAVLTVDVTNPDIRSQLPERFDVLAAGFPCQDLSQAGRTSGINGSQSGLIGHVFDLVRRRRRLHRPQWIILENVSFMRHLDGGKGMEFVLSALSDLGYRWAYREIDTLAFGLPQRRKRLFIVACGQGNGDPRRVLLDGDVKPASAMGGAAWREGRACGFYWTEGNRGVGWADDAIPTLKGGSGVGIPSPPAIILPPDGALVLPTIRDAERLQGFPRGWTDPAAEVDERSGRICWRLVGNAVSVPVAQWIGERLQQADQVFDRDDEPMEPGSKWPTAAWQLDPGGPRFVAKVGGWPTSMERTPLLSIIEEEEEVDRNQLSFRATSGFLRRFEASNLLKRFPEHRSAFLEILRLHADRIAAR